MGIQAFSPIPHLANGIGRHGKGSHQQVDRGNSALPTVGFPSSGSGSLFGQGMTVARMREYFLPIVTFFGEAACKNFLAVYVSNRLHTNEGQRGTQKKDTLMEQK